MNNLIKYGASQRFIAEAGLYPDLILARVISQYKDLYKIVTQSEEVLAQVSGKFRHEATCIAAYPAVGDFVMVDPESIATGNGIIHEILTRKSSFERKAVGGSQQNQVVAANIDLVFICMSLNNDYNLSRLERYLAIAWDSGAKPVIILTKSDLCEDLSQILLEIDNVTLGADVIVTSSLEESSWSKLLPYLQPGVTASFIGSSGVGKSTLINCLAGSELLATSDIRSDDKGRHTSTRRELLVLPQGGVVIDTPGMRELGMTAVDLGKTFADIQQLADKCRFRDCTHTNEPGCAVQMALASGELDQRHFDNYLKLEKESGYAGLSSREIETKKLNAMFSSVGGMKKAKDFIREVKKKR